MEENNTSKNNKSKEPLTQTIKEAPEKVGKDQKFPYTFFMSCAYYSRILVLSLRAYCSLLPTKIKELPDKRDFFVLWFRSL